MKYFLLLVFVIFSFDINAQTINNNKIENVKELIVNNPNTNISIAKLIINESLPTKMYLIKIIQKDSANWWYTSIYLGNNNLKLPVFGVDLNFKFNNHPDSVGRKGAAVEMDLYYGFTDPLNYQYKSAQIIRRFNNALVVVFFFKSRKRLFTTISGIDGLLPID
jgi:hypothetical protein